MAAMHTYRVSANFEVLVRSTNPEDAQTEALQKMSEALLVRNSPSASSAFTNALDNINIQKED